MTTLLQKHFTLKNGIWYSAEAKNISYDKEGTSNCFQIEDTSYWFKHRQNCIDILIDRYCKESQSFADVGGGNGFVTLHLQNKNLNSYLIEPSEDAVKNAQRRNVKNIICANIEHLSNTEIKFDNAGAFDVIEHIADDEKFLSAISKTMVSGGKLFVTVPAFNVLWSNEDDKIGHQRRYTRASLNAFFIKNNFVQIKSSYIFSFLFFPVLFLRSLPSKLGLGKDKKVEMTDNYEYSSKNPVVNFILNCFTKLELFALKKNIYIPFGSSILAVFEKK